MRVLVTGSRDWSNRAVIYLALHQTWEDCTAAGLGEFTVVHGACPTGADEMADVWARVMEVRLERHPANWDKHGKAAGFLRNRVMVDLGADLCLAFIKNESKGATMTADLAEKAGIKTVRFTA